MRDSDEVMFPPDQRDPRWFAESPVMVRWDARRELEVAVVSAIGTIMVWRNELPDDCEEGDEEAHYVKVGEIRISKPFLSDQVDANMEMDALTGDHDYLASALLDGNGYDEDFYDWYEAEFGLMVGGDPVFVLDLRISEAHRDPEALVTAHAALDALATFGSMTSPLVTFDVEQTNPNIPPGLREEASWTWVHALRAKRWKYVYVVARP
ncbi:hypothetical protein [Paraliomyxa miuraensis]|uniref:hypothetical protein n=1 Tax=Paraliomyxa miuraensis TaxID=376150 RepID=UPI002253DE1F|nr:hypothetical protein [Paraliomyxa miuraensis]MCX4239749.1 hypothetical protein [Paraliomyxa miuraensis]